MGFCSSNRQIFSAYNFLQTKLGVVVPAYKLSIPAFVKVRSSRVTKVHNEDGDQLVPHKIASKSKNKIE